MALALGSGTLSNPSFRPNARYDDVGPQTKGFTAVRDIAPGEEITVNYNGAPTSRAAVWFEIIAATTAIVALMRAGLICVTVERSRSGEPRRRFALAKPEGAQ
jgi:hypothetical protein